VPEYEHERAKGKAMKDSVRAAFVTFTAPLEGVVDHLYLDVKGLATVGVGNLVDPIQYALPLPFVHRVSGAPASRDEIAAEWLRVKNDASLARLGHRAARHATRLCLTYEGIDLLVSRKLAQVDAHLAARFGGWETLPADAQLGVISMAWAAGPSFRFPLFEAALRARDFAMCVRECRLKEEGNPGVVLRNAHNRTLFRNAARVGADGLDPDVLYWPRDLEDAVTALPNLAAMSSDPDLTPEPTVIHDRAKFTAALGDDIAQATLDDIAKRNGGG
jgi:GH24 family phage-related lysozyme (muramidase)